MLGFPQNRWTGLDSRPELGDLAASCPNSAETRGMVASGTNGFPKAQISNKTQIAFRRSVCAILRVHEHLQHSDKVSRYFPAMLAPTLSGFRAAIAQIGRLGNVQHASTDSALGTADHKIRLDRQRHARDHQRVESIGRLAERQSTQTKGIFLVLEQRYDFSATPRFIATFWRSGSGVRLGL
jgi:hypothetical protein